MLTGLSATLVVIWHNRIRQDFDQEGPELESQPFIAGYLALGKFLILFMFCLII